MSKFTESLHLNPAQKLQLIEELWDDLSASPQDVPVHDWQKSEVERRRSNLDKNPASAVTWDELIERLGKNHGR